MTRLAPLLLLSGLLIAPVAMADLIPPEVPPAAVGTSLVEVHRQRLDWNLTGMKVLGGLGTLSLASGLALGLTTTNERDRSFHLMNAGWGAVDLGLALAAGWSAAHTDPASLTLVDAVQEARFNQGMFLFNAGLDLAYVAFGWWMSERARRGDDKAAFFEGAGPAVMLQGGALFAFDLAMFLVHRAGNDVLDQLVALAAGR